MKIPSYTPQLVVEAAVLGDLKGTSYKPKYAAGYPQQKSRHIYTPEGSYSTRGIYNLLRSLYRRSRIGPRRRNRKANCFYCGGKSSPIPITPTALSRLTANQKPLTPHCPNCAAA
ncbi:MAG: hypothetical protein HYT71_00645 [Candidatus Aenigmarchaeota archaeon]|nr:hypothetical protein [Candidatus Aenigmarchaeota archaeon]